MFLLANILECLLNDVISRHPLAGNLLKLDSLNEALVFFAFDHQLIDLSSRGDLLEFDSKYILIEAELQFCLLQFALQLVKLLSGGLDSVNLCFLSSPSL
jgi:hypothetical protein